MKNKICVQHRRVEMVASAHQHRVENLNVLVPKDLKGQRVQRMLKSVKQIHAPMEELVSTPMDRTSEFFLCFYNQYFF